MRESDVVFLGTCERAAYVKDGNTNLHKWNIIGLKNVIFSHIFPLSLIGFNFGFAISSKKVGDECQIEVIDEFDKVHGSINLSMKSTSSDDEDFSLNLDSPPVLMAGEGHLVFFVPIKDDSIIIGNPGSYRFSIKTEDGPKIIGNLNFVVVDPPPLTPERITAIRSEPRASKAIRMELGCKHCPKKYKFYTALERKDKMEQDGWNWYETIPDEFICKCKKTVLNLTILRRNLHGLLGRSFSNEEAVDFLPLYEKSTLETVLEKFNRLLNSDPREEILQIFINENPILLHQFPAQFIFPKPPILTFFNADFGIVTSQKELERFLSIQNLKWIRTNRWM